MSAAKHKSKSVSNMHDPRAQRTIEQIDSAFAALIHRRSYAGIRVSDITRKARVGRATFYAHYTSKHDLLRSQVRRKLAPMLRDSPGDSWLFDCTQLFVHVEQSRQVYRYLTAGSTRPVTERIMQDVFEERALERLTDMKFAGMPATPFVVHISARFVAASLLTMLAWWIENDASPSAQTLQALYQSLVGKGLSAATGSQHN